MIALTLSVGAELQPKGIRVNAIVPGSRVTQMTAGVTTGDPDAGMTGTPGPSPYAPPEFAAAALVGEGGRRGASTSHR